MLSPAEAMYAFCIPDASPRAVPAAVRKVPPLLLSSSLPYSRWSTRNFNPLNRFRTLSRRNGVPHPFNKTASTGSDLHSSSALRLAQLLCFDPLAHSLKNCISRKPFRICALRTLLQKQGGHLIQTERLSLSSSFLRPCSFSSPSLPYSRWSTGNFNPLNRFRTLSRRNGGWGVTSFQPKGFGSFRPGFPSFRPSDGTLPNTLLDLRLRPRHYRYCQNVATARPPHPSYGCQVRWVADGGDT